MKITEDKAGLYQELSNAKRAAEISKETGCVLPPGYRLLRLDDRAGRNKDEYEIALINDVNATVAYYNQVAIDQKKAKQKAWRSPDVHHSAALKEIADKVFFDYILRRHDVILSDDEHTGEGRHHWQRQLSHALNRGMKVDYYHAQNELKTIANQNALRELIDELWSTTHEQSSTVALISKRIASHA